MWKRLQKIVTTPSGIVGTAIAAFTVIKDLWRFVAVGGDMEFLGTIGSRLWGWLDSGSVRLFMYALGVLLIIRALKSKPVQQGKTRYHSSLDDLDLIHLSALQYILKSGPIPESELSAYLVDRGFSVSSNCIEALEKQAGEIVDKTHDGRVKVREGWEDWLKKDLPQFKLGKCSEKQIRRLVNSLQAEIEQLKATPVLRTVDFYPTRQSSGINLPDLLKDSKVDVFWMITPAATTFTSQNCYKLRNANGDLKIPRLILLSPAGNAFEAFARVEPDRTKDKLIGEITGTVQTLREAGLLTKKPPLDKPDLDLKFIDAPFNPTIIANPEHGEYGWIQVEVFYPRSASEKRSLIRIWKHEHPERFKEIVEAYKQVWLEIATSEPSKDPTVELAGRLEVKDQLLSLADKQIANLTDLRDSYKKELETTEGKVAELEKSLESQAVGAEAIKRGLEADKRELRSGLRALRKERAFKEILQLGLDESSMNSRNLAAEIKYFDFPDRDLALQLAEPFKEDINKPSWCAVMSKAGEDVSLVGDGQPRILVSSKDQDLAIRLTNALNEVVEESVVLDADKFPQYDVRITIYPKRHRG